MHPTSGFPIRFIELFTAAIQGAPQLLKRCAPTTQTMNIVTIFSQLRLFSRSPDGRFVVEDLQLENRVERFCSVLIHLSERGTMKLIGEF